MLCPSLVTTFCGRSATKILYTPKIQQFYYEIDTNDGAGVKKFGRSRKIFLRAPKTFVTSSLKSLFNLNFLLHEKKLP